jgi:hypothetical protein
MCGLLRMGSMTPNFDLKQLQHSELNLELNIVLLPRSWIWIDLYLFVLSVSNVSRMPSSVNLTASSVIKLS